MRLNEIRERLDRIDNTIVLLIAERLSLMPHVAELKIKNNLPVKQPEREKDIIRKVREAAEKNKVNPDLCEQFFRLLINESCDVQEKIIKKK